MSKLSQIVSPDADLAEQRNFFDAVKSNACVRLALKISAMRAALAEADGARGVLAEHAARGVVGEVALCESLATEVSALSGMVSEAQVANAACDKFIADARNRFAAQTCQAVRTTLDGECVEIPGLEAKIRGYDRARAEHRERLLEAGLDSEQIDSADLLKPGAKELANWRRDLAAKRDQVLRAKAFIASGPLFDVTLLEGGAHAVG
ncbi:hypothetical protein [Paraburkholderia sp. CI3]|uniref:hypothetical protein n=1 Tax=Paraburkholderia sp. CI3 TaxID=2991060 RepID=UPI003D252CEA